MLTDHAMGLIEEGGRAAVTFAALASRIGHSPQAIQKWVDNSAQLMVVITATFGQRWQQWVSRRRYEHGALGLLPETEEEVAWTRVLLALEQHAREQVVQHPELAAIFADMRSCERWVWTTVHPALDAGDEADTLERLTLLVGGLRSAVCRPDDPLPTHDARSILAADCRERAGPLDSWLSARARHVVGVSQVG
jgi:hypothetical protein